MKTTFIAVVGVLLTVAPVHAHGNGSGFGAFGNFGGFDFGGWGWSDHHDGFGGLGFGLGLGFTFGFADPQRTEDRIESQFDSLKTKYDDGVANTTDFFSSTTYDSILGKTQRLNDFDTHFIDGVQNSIDRVTNLISSANDNLDYFNDLLADYQADTTIPADRLTRIEDRINRITDRISAGIDKLTDKQTTLQTNLPTYQSFQTDLSTFLSDITAAGNIGGTGGGSSSSLKLMALAVKSSSGSGASPMASCVTTSSPLEPSSVPEPPSALLVVLAMGVIGALRNKKAQYA